RSWEWIAGANPPLRPPATWILGTSLLQPVFGAAPGPGQISASSDQVPDPGPPSLRSPMHWVTAPGAAYMSHPIGCRLPTPARRPSPPPRRGTRAFPTQRSQVARNRRRRRVHLSPDPHRPQTNPPRPYLESAVDLQARHPTEIPAIRQRGHCLALCREYLS